MKLFKVRLKGRSPLMHHKMSSEALMGLLMPKSKKKKVKEETRTPREIAESHAYKAEDGSFYIPAEYLVGAFKDCASDYKQKDSQRKSYKTIAAGIFRTQDPTSTLLDDNGKPLKSFELDIRRGTNHQKGAVAICRPRFDQWNIETTVQIDDSLIDQHTALEILQDAGRRAGLGSFRVARGGFYGQFSVEEFTEIK